MFEPKTKISKKIDVLDQSTYFIPSQIRTAYGVNSLNAKGLGIGICIVIAFHYPNLQRDFNVFCDVFSLPRRKITIINLGATEQNDGWALECCLDVQWAHAIALNSQIIVVEAKTNSLDDMYDAVKYANDLPSVNIISMSWGTGEFSEQADYDDMFSNKNITYLAASGDLHQEIIYPSSSPNVIAVGGSSLYLNNDNTRNLESVWAESGTGYSEYFSRPSYQDLSTVKLTPYSGSQDRRITPDLALVANPSTGLIVVFDGYYYIVGGTSASCPIMAGVIALSNQIRFQNSKKMLTSVVGGESIVQDYIYENIYGNKPYGIRYNRHFYDIVTGSDGVFVTKKGYDCSGLGSIYGTVLCRSLANA